MFNVALAIATVVLIVVAFVVGGWVSAVLLIASLVPLGWLVQRTDSAKTIWDLARFTPRGP